MSNRLRSRDRKRVAAELTAEGPTAMKSRAIALVRARNHGDRKEDFIDELIVAERTAMGDV